MKESLDHISGILSNRTLFPGLGALGRIREAAVALSVVRHAAAAAPAVANTASPTEYARTTGENMNLMGGIRYSRPYS